MRNGKQTYSSGNGEIPTSIIKLAKYELKHVLSFIINNFFEFASFSNQLRIALLNPIYKKGDPQILDSYTPISLLPGFSKLFELF